MEGIVTTNQDYRNILLNEYESRSKNNPRYSLRAFARDLSISPSRLNDVLKGRYGLSAFAGERIASSLGFSKNEKDYFVTLIESQHARSVTKRKSAENNLKKYVVLNGYKELQEDAFKLMSDWYHLAIVELTYVKGFKNNTDWIAKRLGITPFIVTQAINRLKRFDILKEENGLLIATDDFTKVPGGTPSLAIKKFHKQIIEKASKALFHQTVENREFSSNIMAIKKEKLTEAKKAIKAFRRKFAKDISGNGNKDQDSVYCLSIQFFELEDSNNGESDK